jgi:nickel-dependent lactate racemase
MPKVAFGAEELEFDPEPGDQLEIFEPADADLIWNPAAFIDNLKQEGFEQFLSKGKPLVVVNDAFRPTPTGSVLTLLAEAFPQFSADFIVACGNHPPPDQSDVEKIFAGYKLPADSKLFFHEARDEASLTKVGDIDNEPVYVNSRLFEYPGVLIIGSVEPHYFAGFTGGRKSLIPGLVDYETTRRNHALAVSPDSRPLRLEGNPVAENLDRLLALVTIENLFSIQLVTERKRQILAAFCGSLSASFTQAAALATKLYSFSVSDPYDLVIAEMRQPLDRNLYQMQKSIENNAAIVADKGTLLAVSRCNEGIGNDEFYHLAAGLDNEEMALSHAELPNPPMGIHKLSRIVELQKRINVRALTGLKHEIIEQVFIEPAVSIEAEMEKLRMEKRNLRIALIRNAGLLVGKLA